jgi:hypothetical protein
MDRNKAPVNFSSNGHVEQADLALDPTTYGSPVLPPEEAPDPFDPDSLRLSSDVAANLGVKKALLTIPVRKPAREWFIRVHPDPTYRLQTAVLELKEKGETYLVSPALWAELAGESTLSPRILFTSITRQNVLFFWPIRMPGSDGRLDAWSRSALDAAEMAQAKWVRIQADLGLGAYSVCYAEHLPEPEWPDVPFREMLRIAFREQFIQSLNHPVLRTLRGEV